MRIAVISNYLPSGSKIGVGHQVHALANGLSDRGHAVTVFSACPSSDGARYITKTVPLRGRLRTFKFALQLRKVDFRGFEVIHAHGDDYWLWRRRAPVHVRTMHGSCLSEAIRIHGAKAKLRMLALGLTEELSTFVADKTVVVSPPTRRWMPWVHDVVPNGVPSTFAPGGERAGDPTVLFVGTYEQRKRGRLLMEVFAREVLPSVPDARLDMVCSDAPPAQSVTVHGQISEMDLVDLYRRAWVFCLPSSYEGFGIPYAEAQACGTPVVATDNPGAAYVLDGGKAGLITDADGLGAALVRLLSDVTERRRLETAGLLRAKTFAMESVLDRYEGIYARLAATAR